MRNRIIGSTLAFVICIGSIGVGQAEAYSVTPDKRTHYYVSATGTLVGSLFFREIGVDPFPSILYSSLIMTTAGLVKEIYDDPFSGPDMVANGAGVISGALVAGLIFQF